MKRLIRVSLGIFYLAAILFSLIVLVKAGASDFYFKAPVLLQSLSRIGAAYEYPLKVNTNIYDPKTIIVFEDQKMLTDSSPEDVKAQANGAFALEAVSEGEISVLISPTGLSDPATNGHRYQVYIRPYLISSNLGGIYSLVLLVGLFAFLTPGLMDPQKRKVLFGSPFGFVSFWVSLFDWPIQDASTQKVNSFPKSSAASWAQAAVFLVLASYFYILMEWIFFVTKSSFMDGLSLGEKFNNLLVDGFAVALLSLLALFIFFLLDRVGSPFFPVFRRYARHIPFAFLSTCLCLILIDNFTYTVFKFGVVDTSLGVRLVYALGFTGIFSAILQKMAGSGRSASSQVSGRIYTISAAGLMGISLILAGFTFRVENHPVLQVGQDQTASQKPNIIFLSSDGVNAKNMSVYGYERDTTPFLTELAKTSLISENNFTNAGHTLGSTTSILTGKLPLATHVLYPPDTLMGEDQYQHLPGMLKNIGYRTLQLGTPYYVDANFTSFKHAFDAVNCVENFTDNLTSFISSYGFNNAFYMFTTIIGRINDRVSHIFFLKDMENPYALVTRSVTNRMDDKNRIGCLFKYLDQASQAGQPLFAQMHLLGTHGPMFYPSTQVYSKNEIQNNDWMTDFSDDAILDFDAEVKQVVQYLKDHGLYDHTILVVYTDHGQRFVTTNRIPLMIHFPNDQHSGVLTANTQIIDVPPTVLDYMGIQKPAWMEGDSLLGRFDPNRLILGSSTNKYDEVWGTVLLVEANLKPPFYQFSQLTVIQCQNLFVFNLDDLSMNEEQVAGYVNPCPPEKLDSPQQMRAKVGKILTQLGYALPSNW